MKRSFIAIASILAIVAGCAKNDVQSKLAASTVKVTIESADTKATLNTETFYQNFETTDHLAVYDGVSAKDFTLASGQGTKDAVFTSETPLATAEKYYAVYPYNSNITGTGNVISMAFYSSFINYDSTINKAEGGNNVMAAISTDGSFSLKNICSYILFDIQSYAADHLVTSIVISDPDDKYIAGWATLTFDESGEVAVAIDEEQSPEKTITINCGTSGVSTAQLKPFIIAVPPVFANGFKMTVNFTEGAPLELSTSTPVGRNEVVTMPAIEFDAPAVVEVNGKTYSSIYKGIRAANATASDVNVKLLADITGIQDSVVVDNAADKLTTLDLNGHTLSCKTEGVNKTVYTKTDLTVCDNSVEGTGKIEGLHGAITANQGKLTINSGSFEADGYTEDGDGVIYSYGGSSYLTINGGTFTIPDGDLAGRIVNVTNAGQINGGKFICNSTLGYVIRTYKEIADSLSVENVQIYTKGNKAPLNSGALTAIIKFKSGYVYSETAHIKSHEDRISVIGGHFNQSLLAEDGYKCIEDAVTGPDGRSYSHGIAEETENCASVNGTEYRLFGDAVKAANAYDGSIDTVLIKLLKDFGWGKSVNLTNASGKNVCLDINGKTLTVAIDSCFSSAGSLRVKDSGTAKGKIVSETPRIFVKNTVSKSLGGNLYLDGCTVECSYSSSSTGTGSTTGVISLYGKSGSAPKLIMLNGAVINKTAPGKAVFIRYANMDMTDSEINCTADADAGDNSGWCIYTYANLTLNISNSSLYSQSNSCIKSYSSYPAINIKSGAYLYSGSGINCIVASSASYGKYNLYPGSYYSADPKPATAVASVTLKSKGTVQSASETKYGRTYTYKVQ